jgi:hypothetical protein
MDALAHRVVAPQVERIAGWLAHLVQPDQLIELRGLHLPNRRAVSHYFTGGQLPALAAKALELEAAEAKGCYVTLNPLRPDLAGARAAARDADVLLRRWLLVDVDPVRPADTSATSAEKAAAWEVLQNVQRFLATEGLPAPSVADSANGWHLLYPIQLPNDEPGKALVKTFLHELHARFSTDRAKVDTTTYNAARIVRLYGTLSRKGEATAERPHRRSWLAAAQPWEPGDSAALLAGVLDRWGRIDRMRQGRPEGGRNAYALKALREECDRVASAVGGTRNTQLFKSGAALGNLIAGGLLDRATVALELTAAARSCGLPEAEIGDVLARAIPTGETTPRTAPVNGHVNGRTQGATTQPDRPVEWEPILPLSETPLPTEFPLHVLPAPLRQYAAEAAWAHSCPVDFVAVPMLAIAGAAVGNTRRLAITRDHLQSACLFTAVIGDPGTGKSHALEAVAAPLEKAQDKYLDDWRLAVAERNKPENANSTEPPPTLRRCLVDDATTEALVSLLGENPRGMLMLRDELAALVTGMNQYRSGGKGHDRQVYLKLWSHQKVRIDRKGGDRITVHRPFLAITGGIQPKVIERLRSDPVQVEAILDDGFIDRFLLSYPPDAPVTEERWREVSEQAADAWDVTVRRLLELEPDLKRENGHQPRLVHLDDSGRLAWVRFTRQHAAEVNDEDFPSHLKGPWSKLRGYCGRLALLLHLLQEVWSGGRGPIDGDTIDRAAALTAYFKAHAQRVYTAMDADPRVAQARAILRWVQRHERQSFTRRELYIGIKRQTWANRVEALSSPLNLLVQHGYLREQGKPQSSGGRPPSQAYDVHPLYLPSIPSMSSEVSRDHDL